MILVAPEVRPYLRTSQSAAEISVSKLSRKYHGYTWMYPCGVFTVTRSTSWFNGLRLPSPGRKASFVPSRLQLRGSSPFLKHCSIRVISKTPGHCTPGKLILWKGENIYRCRNLPEPERGHIAGGDFIRTRLPLSSANMLTSLTMAVGDTGRSCVP